MTDAEYQAFVERVTAEQEEEDKKYSEKLRRVNAIKRARAKQRKLEREMGIYVEEKKLAPRSICPNCKNCVPNLEKRTGCEWSVAFRPVPGWNAVRNDLRPLREGGQKLMSYAVLECPKFERG